MRPYALALLFAALAPLSLSAQSLDVGSSENAFAISVTPEFLAPGGTATLSFLSSALDLANATLRVTANGKEVYAGAVRDVRIPVGKAGSPTNVNVIVTVRGTPYSQSVTLAPQDVVLVAEPVATAPALYPGKPQVPLEGMVRVVALANVRTANGAAVSPAALSYAWTVDDTRIQNASGIGKSAIMVASPLQFRSRQVSVSVTSGDGSLSGGASLSLTPAEPKVRIYQNDALLGVLFDRALSGQYVLQGAETSLFAAPFSLPNTNLSLEWFLDGVSAQTGNAITLRPAGSGTGRSSLSVAASSGNARATSALTLSFGKTNAFNFFGL